MKKLYLFTIAILILFVGFANTQNVLVEDVQVTPNVIYGTGKILKDNKQQDLPLWMDVYTPKEKTLVPRPAVILTHGGSFHRGNPRERFNENGAQTTSMKEYAERLAKEGFVCFTIKYRLAPDLPIIDNSKIQNEDLDPSVWNNPQSIQFVNTIRQKMNLESISLSDSLLIKNAVLAAAEDLQKAIHFIKNGATTYNIDANKIALGGYSAGAATAINVAYGKQEKVNAVFVNSGLLAGFNLKKTLANTKNNPPILLFEGQYDLNVVALTVPYMIQLFDKNNVTNELVWVPGFSHYYPAGATGLSFDGQKISIEERIINFLKEHLK